MSGKGLLDLVALLSLTAVKLSDLFPNTKSYFNYPVIPFITMQTAVHENYNVSKAHKVNKR